MKSEFLKKKKYIAIFVDVDETVYQIALNQNFIQGSIYFLLYFRETLENH